MCLTVDKEFNNESTAIEYTKNPKIAGRDRVVYKVLDKDNKSPYQGFKYHKGFLYYQTNKKKPFDIGVHSFWWGVYKININDGLHAFITKDAAEYLRIRSKVSELRVVKMVIPKGARYFLGDDNDKYQTS